MGSPKALLDFDGETFLDRLIRLFAACCSPVVEVLGSEPERIRGGLRAAGGAQLVVNANWPAGQLTSLQCGLAALAPETEAVMFTLVDHPAVRPATLEALLAEPPAPLRIPSYQGRRGHPVLASGALIPEFLALSVDGAARDVVNRHAAGIHYLETDDPGVIADIDDPEAYRRLVRGARL
jgi:molybdenum cofactor cytidylyltransferase